MVRWRRTTNSKGYEAAAILQPALCKVTAKTPGFKPVRYENVKLDVAQTIRTDLNIEIADSCQSVDVRDTAELLGTAC